MARLTEWLKGACWRVADALSPEPPAREPATPSVAVRPDYRERLAVYVCWSCKAEGPGVSTSLPLGWARVRTGRASPLGVWLDDIEIACARCSPMFGAMEFDPPPTTDIFGNPL